MLIGSLMKQDGIIKVSDTDGVLPDVGRIQSAV